MPQLNILFCGCGFLASHLIPHVLPFTKHIILLDKDRIEKVNYDNSIFPKNYIGRRKVTALASMVQMLSSIQTTPIHLNLKSTNKLEELCTEYEIDLIFVTFDNIESRLIVRDFAIKSKIPTLFIGITLGYIYIDWAEKVVLPASPEEIQKLKKEAENIRDVCTRLEFRTLGVISAGYAYFVFIKWLDNQEKFMHNITIRDKIESTILKR